MLTQSDLTQHSIDSCSTAIFWIRKDGTIWNFNSAAASRLGYAREELSSANFIEIAPSYSKQSWQDLWEQVSLQSPWTFETQLQAKDGTLLPVNLSTDLIDFEDEKFLLILAIDISLRKQAEQDLRSSESIQRSIMESSLDSIILLDRMERIRFINRSAPGLSVEQVIGTSICDYVDRKFHPTMRACFQRVLTTGQPDGFHVDYHLADGTITTWESRVAPVRTGNQVTGLTVIARDVTDRNSAIRALRANQHSLAKAQQIARMGSWEFDLSTWQPTASAELFRILGLGEHEPLPSLESFIHEMIHPDDQDQINRSFEAVLTTGVIEPREFRIIRHSDQQIRHVRAEAEIVIGGNGLPAKMIGTFHDISERKATEIALRESEEKFRVLTERSPAIVFIARAKRIIYCNAKTTEVTGYSTEELKSMDFTDIIHPDYRELVTQRHGQRLEGETPQQRYEIKIITKQGTHRWLDLSAQLIEFEGLPAVLVACVDNTQRKEAEAKLCEMNAQLAHVTRLATMGEMVAGIAHEINQPLSAIANFAWACRNVSREADGLEKQRMIGNWLEEITDQAVRCGDIIRHLREFSKKPQDDHKWVDLNQVVLDSFALIKSDFRNGSIALKYDWSGTMPRVYANPIELQQVLVNLLRNSCEATRQCRNPEVILRLSQQQGFACITVEDNGTGVDVPDSQRLFDAFFTTKPDGMGMGLAISKSIVEAHRGTLRFEPGEHSGAKFQLRIPISNPNAKEAS